MSFEELDKKIQEAADLHHPAYHADAWSKMEKLLDEHLPVKEKKKRRIIFWWFIPLLIGGAFLASRFILTNNKPVADKNSSAAITNQKIENTSLQSQKATVNKKVDLKNLTTDVKQTLSSTSALSQNVFLKHNSLKKVAIHTISGNRHNSQPYLTTSKKTIANTSTDILSTPEQQNRSIGINDKNSSPTSVNNNLGEPVAKQSALATKEIDITQPSTTADNNKTAAGTIPTPAADSTLKKATTSSAKSKKKNHFFVSFSAAADVSFVTGNNPGTAKIISGGGIGYSIKDKITIRAGFYSGRKVYEADGNSYKGDATFYQYYPYLESVNANCKVYEIPISASISFAKRKKDNLFASAGISTLLMKKETYDYYYKHTPTGSLYEKSWTINNKNKHFFSVLTLSGGYQHTLGKKTFFIVEPYFKMPLSGVGAGKIKLNSTGILFTAGVKLF